MRGFQLWFWASAKLGFNFWHFQLLFSVTSSKWFCLTWKMGYGSKC